jgi:hypothetical protein
MKGFLKYLSEKIENRIKEVMEKQLYNWHPNSRAWKDFKQVVGLSPKVWIASGWIKGSITFWYSRMAKSYIIGVNPRKMHREYKHGGVKLSKRSGVLLKDILRKLEFGTSNTVARPLFVPVFNEVKKDIDIHFSNYTQKPLRNESYTQKTRRSVSSYFKKSDI